MKTKFKIGDIVKWDDPGINDYFKEDRKFKIFKINGEIIFISDGFSETEVTENELELWKKETFK